jgi:hypothetical protein
MTVVYLTYFSPMIVVKESIYRLLRTCPSSMLATSDVPFWVVTSVIIVLLVFDALYYYM